MAHRYTTRTGHVKIAVATYMPIEVAEQFNDYCWSNRITPTQQLRNMIYELLEKYNSKAKLPKVRKYKSGGR